MTIASKKDDMVPKRVTYIHYSIKFKNNKVKVLIDLGNKVNIMTLTYAVKLNLKIYVTNIRTRKIDGLTFKIFEIVLNSFRVEDKFSRPEFFKNLFYWLTPV